LDASVEPIARDVGSSEVREIDARIARMARVEVIRGVTVGFERLEKTTVRELSTEEAALVLWRREKRLYGALVRARRRLDLDALARGVPALVREFEKATAPAR
jgi:hypothetical protein